MPTVKSCFNFFHQPVFADKATSYSIYVAYLNSIKPTSLCSKSRQEKISPYPTPIRYREYLLTRHPSGIEACPWGGCLYRGRLPSRRCPWLLLHSALQWHSPANLAHTWLHRENTKPEEKQKQSWIEEFLLLH